MRAIVQRTIDAPQVAPPPEAASPTLSPGARRPARTTSSRLIGIDADEVFP